MSAQLRLAQPEDLPRLMGLVAAFHAEMGIDQDEEHRHAALLPLLEGIPHGCIYLIGPEGKPYRIGFALMNEFSDHIVERQNYLWLAHSKLRPSSFGPEILVGKLPRDVQGTSRITRGKKTIFEQPFLTGEANMSHTVKNLEDHHFKYPTFRRPGDVHVHCFGTATLSFAAGVQTKKGDVFTIEAPEFGLPLSNPLDVAKSERVTIKAL